MSNERMRIPRRAIVGMLAGAVMISTAAPLVRAAEAPSISAVFYRMLIGAIALFAIAALRQENVWAGWRHVLRAAPAGVFFTLDLYLWHQSILTVGPGLATILVNLQVVIMGIAGFLVFKESVTWRFYAGLACIVPGVWLLVGMGGGGGVEGYERGVLYGILAAVAYAGFVLSMRFTQSADDSPPPSVNLGYASVWTMLGAVVLAVATGELDFWRIGSPKVALLFVAYGVVCQAIGWLMITRASPNLPAALIGLFLLIQPALSFVWDVAFFARATTWLDVFGITLVLTGVFFASFRKAPEPPAASA